MAQVSSFAGQNWLIFPTTSTVHNSPLPQTDDRSWLLVLTGVCIVDLRGNNADDWRRESLTITPDISAPLQHAINHYGVNKPLGALGPPQINAEQWSPFAAVSSFFDKDTGGVNVGAAVDVWRPRFSQAQAWDGQTYPNIFSGIDVDIAVRNNKAVLHRISYHITVLGKIVFMPGSLHP